MAEKRKAIVVAVMTLLGVVATWAATGELDAQELSVAISGVVTTVLVYAVPNQPPRDR